MGGALDELQQGVTPSCDEQCVEIFEGRSAQTIVAALETFQRRGELRVRISEAQERKDVAKRRTGGSRTRFLFAIEKLIGCTGEAVLGNLELQDFENHLRLDVRALPLGNLDESLGAAKANLEARIVETLMKSGRGARRIGSRQDARNSPADREFFFRIEKRIEQLSDPLGGGLGTVIVAIAITRIPFGGRVIRAVVLSLKEMQYVEAARGLGASHLRMMARHILPQCVAPFLILATAHLGVAIIIEASLGFLGVGIPPPTPTWGNMLADSLNAGLVPPWWLVLFPGCAITLTVLAFNLLGDGIRDVLDPRLRGAV